MLSFEFLLTALVVVLMPGTGVIYTVAVGLGRGFKSSIAAALGCTLGILPSAIASIVGLSAILHSSALAFLVVKWLGVLYLFYMAWNILRDKTSFEVNQRPNDKKAYKIIISGALLNVLNPKLTLFFMAFLPQFVSSNAINPTLDMSFMGVVFMIMTFLVFILYGLFASVAREYVIERPNVMNLAKKIFAGAFGFLGVKLAFSN